MVSKKKKSKYSSPTLEEQQKWEKYLETVSTLQTEEMKDFSANDTLYGDMVKNKTKKFKSKNRRSCVRREAEVLWNDNTDNRFESVCSGSRKKAKKSKRQKDKHQKQKKNKDKSDCEDICLLPLPVKQRKVNKNKRLCSFEQDGIVLLDKEAETSASQEIKFSESGGIERYESLGHQYVVSKGSYHQQRNPEQALVHTKKLKDDVPLRKRVMFDPLPFSLDFDVSSQVKKGQGDVKKQRNAPQTSPLVSCGKRMLFKPGFGPRKMKSVSEDESDVVDHPWEYGCKVSQGTVDNNNSQDLFITQKTVPPAESSSNESVSLTTSFPLTSGGQPDRQGQQQSQGLFLKLTAEKATQTNDFFSSPGLCMSFRFHKLHQRRDCTEQALDLSLPKIPHRKPSSVKQEWEEASCDLFDPKIKGSISSEQSCMHAMSKTGITQLKVVQTRLNESFFFRMKGDEKFSKPQSPLMNISHTKSKMPQMSLTMKARHSSDLN